MTNTWLTPGSTVAIYSAGRGASSRASYRMAKVDRLTATQAVVGGDRYRLDTLTQVGVSRYGSAVLVPADDPRLAEVDKKDHLIGLRGSALGAVDEWRVGAGGSPKLARAAAAALLAYADGWERS